MKKKTFELKFKQFDDHEGIVEGFATTFGFPADLDGDIISEKAFDESLIKVNQSGIPLLDGHNRDSVTNIIGTVISAVKTSRGIYIKDKLADTDSNIEIFQKLKQGHINKFSIGMMVEDTRFIEKDGIEFREITKAELFEVSLVAIPANPNAAILAIKSVESSEDVIIPTRENIENPSREEAIQESLEDLAPVLEEEKLSESACEEVDAEISVEVADKSEDKLESNDFVDALRLQLNLLEEQIEITRRKLGYEE